MQHSFLNRTALAQVIFLAADDAAAATTTAATPPADPKAVTVADMPSRRVFATVEEAANALNADATKYTDFASVPLAAQGLTEDGFDPEVYTPGMAVMVATLRKVGTAGQKGKIKAIVVTPIPTLENLMSDESGKDWVEKIIQKELNHVAVRQLREAEDVAAMADQMPKTRDAFITASRDSGGGIMETFDNLYQQLNDAMSATFKVWQRARIVKREFKKSLENRAYALEAYPALENRGEGKDSLFKIALELGTKTAKAKGMDPTIFDRWAASRDAKVYDASQEDEDESMDLDKMVASLTKPEPTAQAAATPAPAQAAS